MGILKRTESGHSAIAHKADGNPEGKGLNGFVLDWYQSEPRGVVAKPQRQVLAEFFTSMLVLSASFKFRPAVGTPSYLYWIDGAWSLSLIAVTLGDQASISCRLWHSLLPQQKNALLCCGD